MAGELEDNKQFADRKCQMEAFFIAERTGMSGEQKKADDILSTNESGLTIKSSEIAISVLPVRLCF
jgi:hypothetical protein